MDFNIRQEIESDYREVFELIEKAFQNEPYSDHKEHYLVERLRTSSAFVPQLSIVAELNNKVVGHILFSKISISNAEKSFDSLALAPVSVLPEFQNRGVGGKLIKAGHKVAIREGYNSVILLGHPEYYPRFGYKRAADFGITLPFHVPKENCMAVELSPNSLKNVTGKVVYPKEFYE